MTEQAVAVLTVNYASGRVLASLLDSVPPSVGSHRVRIVVADNKPDPAEGVRELVESRDGLYLPMPSNLGYGHAVNAAVQSLPADCTWILITNPDVILQPPALEILLERGSTDARIAAVGPRVDNPDGSTYPSAREIPSIRTGIGHALLAGVWPSNPWSRRYLGASVAPGEARTAEWLSGSCLLVRRSSFEEIGGFDERFFMYFEDTDLGLRFGQAGYLNVYEPRASVIHEGAVSTRTESAAMIRAHHDSAKKFVSRKYPGPLLWPVRMVLYGGLTVRSHILSRRADRAS